MTAGTLTRSSTTHLEALRDELREIRQRSDPQDYERSPAQAVIRMGAMGQVSAQFLYPGGMGEPMALTRTAARQLAARTLPQKGLGFLRALARSGQDRVGGGSSPGAKLATMAWSTLAREQGQPLLWRTTNWAHVGPHRAVTAIPVMPRPRSVRAVLSQGYATYDNLEMIEDVLTALGPQADHYRVLDRVLTEDAMRVRLVGGSAEALELYRGTQVDKPMPVVEFWDSPTGCRAVWVKSGTFTRWCSNGCGHWSDKAVWRWPHTGRTSERIRVGVASAMTEAATAASGVAAAYDAALETEINDAFGWFEEQVGNMVTQGTREQVRNTMLTEPTVHGNGRLLASVVDAVTYVAHEQADIFEQERLERLGGRLLHAGLQQADEDRRILVAVA